MNAESIALCYNKDGIVRFRYILDGDVTKPGEQFDLNGSTNVRTASIVWDPSIRLFRVMVLVDGQNNGFAISGLDNELLVLDIGPNLDISSVSTLPLVVSNPWMDAETTMPSVSLLLVDGQLTATHSNGILPPHFPTPLAAQSDRWPFQIVRSDSGVNNNSSVEMHGFCRNIIQDIARIGATQSAETTYAADADQSQLRSMEWKQTYKDKNSMTETQQWSFCDLLSSSGEQQYQQSLAEFASLPFSGKVYAIARRDDTSFTIYTMPVSALTKVTSSRDYRWHRYPVIQWGNNLKTNGGCAICVQGSDSTSQPRLYAFFVDNNGRGAKGKVWYTWIPLRGFSESAYGDLAVKPGALQHKAGSILLTGPNMSDCQANTDKLRAVKCNDKIVLFYTNDNKVYATTTSISNQGITDGTWSASVYCSDGVLLTGCAAPSSALTYQ